MTRRLIRLLVTFALGLLVAPLATEAQAPKKVFRLGYVLAGSPGAYTAPDSSTRGLRQGLHDLGYLQGQNLVIEERYAAGQMDRLPELFAELMGL
jgi:putative tryptophan/tyrosine transport system substrate-binding protein